MAQGTIYMVDGENLRRMMPSAPDSEDRMQELVARYPELITDGAGELLLISLRVIVLRTRNRVSRQPRISICRKNASTDYE